MDNVPATGEIISQKFTAVVFSLVFIALAITSVCIYCFNTCTPLMRLIFAHDHFRVLAWVSIIAPFILSFIIRSTIDRAVFPVLFVLFIAYAALVGTCLSFILLDFVDSSLFGISAAPCLVFGVSAMVGFCTQINFIRFRTILAMLTAGIILVTCLVFLLADLQMQWITSCVGVIAVIGIAAFQFEGIKAIGEMPETDANAKQKLALLCALKLYIDYVNLVVWFIEIFVKGNKSDD